MFLSIPVAQTFSLSPENIKAIQDMGIAMIAIFAIVIVVWRLLGVVDRNTRVLDKIADRNADYQTNSLKEKEKTREWISTAGTSVAQMSSALAEMQIKLGKDIEGATDALRGKDGVLDVLRASALQLTGLTDQTQGVVDTAKLIMSKLEQVKGEMASSDSEMKQQIEAIQSLLNKLTSTVQSIPEAVTNAEANIIAAISSKQSPTPSPPSIPPPIISGNDETIATKPQTENGKGKEAKQDETQTKSD